MRSSQATYQLRIPAYPVAKSDAALGDTHAAAARRHSPPSSNHAAHPPWASWRGSMIIHRIWCATVGIRRQQPYSRQIRANKIVRTSAVYFTVGRQDILTW
eukprot:gb/GECG01012115.1/.p1 GENE.gb/GECG01012115.1/~~gb/GECG01012115.1/.p1  ORF type:complete len:101 (+),score=6.53 gb/GECG01012115.1/:1-303(+)